MRPTKECIACQIIQQHPDLTGQEVSHAHLHVVPRFKDEPLASKGIRYWLKQAANRRPAGA